MKPGSSPSGRTKKPGDHQLFIVKPEVRDKVNDALRGLIQVAVDIDREGSGIMVHEPNGIGYAGTTH
jgi:hypothetical protein